MSTEFPLNEKITPLGTCSDPTIIVEVLTKDGFRSFNFIFDTGADCTILPRYLSKIVGVDLSACKIVQSYGLKNEPVKVFVAKITIRIAKLEFPIRCLFTEDDSTSLLLGRMDIFSRFNITFDNKHKKIRLSEI